MVGTVPEEYLEHLGLLQYRTQMIRNDGATPEHHLPRWIDSPRRAISRVVLGFYPFHPQLQTETTAHLENALQNVLKAEFCLPRPAFQRNNDAEIVGADDDRGVYVSCGDEGKNTKFDGDELRPRYDNPSVPIGWDVAIKTRPFEYPSEPAFTEAEANSAS